METRCNQSNGQTALAATGRGVDRAGKAAASAVASPQQITSLSVGLAALLIGGLIGTAGAPIAWAIAAALLVPFAFHGVPLAIEFAVGALIDRRPVARLGCGAALMVWLTETWTAITAFTIDQAWRADFAEPPIKHDASRPAVLFVHGYCCNRGVWKTWIARCREVDRWNVATLNLSPTLAEIDSYAAQLDAAIARLLRASGATRVTLVCHSMGGLVARAYLRARGHQAVNRVITINTPHHGTLFAEFERSVNARQMRRACEYLKRLGSHPEPVEFVCFASHHDNLIVPRDSQVLECAEAVWFERIGHLAMTSDERVFARLIEAIERPAAGR
jgi:pimeloyl-ACP methyl ester carboxylesterase